MHLVRPDENPLHDRVDVRPAEAPARRARCLTELSASLLIAGAMGVSAILWLAILAVMVI